MTSGFWDAVMKRRSIYHLSNKQRVTKEKVRYIVKVALKYAPTPFNSQSGRALLLMRQDYLDFWKIVKEELKKHVPADKFAATEAKIDSFAQGVGTVLFFEDEDVITSLQEKYPLYKENFPIWSEQSNAILQYIVWTAFSEVGIGASLQHYNPLIDERVKERWQLPKSWKLKAQMPFGGIAKEAETKDFMPIEERIKIFEQNPIIE